MSEKQESAEERWDNATARHMDAGSGVMSRALFIREIQAAERAAEQRGREAERERCRAIADVRDGYVYTYDETAARRMIARQIAETPAPAPEARETCSTCSGTGYEQGVVSFRRCPKGCAAPEPAGSEAGPRTACVACGHGIDGLKLAWHEDGLGIFHMECRSAIARMRDIAALRERVEKLEAASGVDQQAIARTRERVEAVTAEWRAEALRNVAEHSGFDSRLSRLERAGGGERTASGTREAFLCHECSLAFDTLPAWKEHTRERHAKGKMAPLAPPADEVRISKTDANTMVGLLYLDHGEHSRNRHLGARSTCVGCKLYYSLLDALNVTRALDAARAEKGAGG